MDKQSKFTCKNVSIFRGEVSYKNRSSSYSKGWRVNTGRGVLSS